MNAAAALAVKSDAGRKAIASFYHLDGQDLRKRRCSGTACFVARRKAPKMSSGELGGGRVYCLGECFTAPAIGVSGARPHIECPAPEPIVLGRILKGGARSLAQYGKLGGYRALSKALAHPREELLAAIERSELRGRGGAAFPTAKKWRAAATQNASEKFIIANGDEGDCGAYIDRFLMEDDPFALIEGMTLAGYAVGAQRGWIYVRAEYPDAEESLKRALAEAVQARVLGKNIFAGTFSFEIELVRGSGSYICGEETALIRSIEGLRPEPQARPPFSAERGLFGMPTVMNNVETLVNVPWIVANSAEAYRSFGFSTSRGTKVVSLNSLFRRPGLYEVEFGVAVRDIVEEIGGGLQNGKIKGVMIGGPLAGIIPPQLFDTPIGFEELREIGASVGHGGVIAFDDRTSIAELIHHVFSFGAYESCGKCTPCRLGARRIEEIFRGALARGGASKEDEREWRRCCEALRVASFCAHGTGLAEFAESAIRRYGKELEACFK